MLDAWREFSFRFSDKVTARLQKWASLNPSSRLALNYEALAFKTILHSAVYYVPQDIAVLGGAFWLRRLYRNRLFRAKNLIAPMESVTAWASARGLNLETDLNVTRSGRRVRVSLKDAEEAHRAAR